MKKSITLQVFKIIIVLLFLASMKLNAQTPIQYGDNVQASISAPAEVDVYTFNGIADEIITLLVAQSPGPILVRTVKIYEPDGTLLLNLSGNSIRIDTTKLLKSGTYTILVSDDNGVETGNYGLTLRRIIAPPMGSVITYGSNFQDSISAVAGINAYLFCGCTNDLIRLNVAQTSGGAFFLPVVEIYDPRGKLIRRASGYTVEIDTMLVQSGTYTIMILDNNGVEVGDFGFSLTRIVQGVACHCTLPLTWLYFKGQQQENSTQLSWATATEQNSKEFIIERSLDGRDYTTIGSVPAAGNSVRNTYYHYDDNEASSLQADILYYRLKQVDLDGKYEYSTIVAISSQQSRVEPLVKANPNPFKQSISLQLMNAPVTLKTDKVTLYSMEGKLLYQKSLASRSTQNVVLNDLPVLSPGTYLLKTVIGGKTVMIKVIRQ
jgi:hypothetical protein